MTDTGTTQPTGHEAHGRGPAASVDWQPRDQALALSLAGHFDATTLKPVWRQVFQRLTRQPPVGLHIDVSGMTYCDGAGLGLLIELDRWAAQRDVPIDFAGLTEAQQRLLERGRLSDLETIAGAEPQKPHSIEYVGRVTQQLLRDCGEMISFVGAMSVAMTLAMLQPHRIRWRDALVIAEKAGVNALPVVCLLGFLMGVIIAFQSAAPLKGFGIEATIPIMLSIGLVRELGPLITAILLAGRSGSAFAAELGTMKVTEEINALTTFGLDPTRFLVVPRMIAAMVMTPLLTLFAILFGLIGGYIVMLSLGYSLPFYVRSVLDAVTYTDLLQGLFKAWVFSILVVGVGCLRGLQTAHGPGAVGDSTTRAVVAGIVLIIAADGVLGVVFYYLGI